MTKHHENLQFSRLSNIYLSKTVKRFKTVLADFACHFAEIMYLFLKKCGQKYCHHQQVSERLGIDIYLFQTNTQITLLLYQISSLSHFGHFGHFGLPANQIRTIKTPTRIKLKSVWIK